MCVLPRPELPCTPPYCFFGSGGSDTRLKTIHAYCHSAPRPSHTRLFFVNDITDIRYSLIFLRPGVISYTLKNIYSLIEIRAWHLVIPNYLDTRQLQDGEYSKKAPMVIPQTSGDQIRKFALREAVKQGCSRARHSFKQTSRILKFSRKVQVHGVFTPDRSLNV